MIIFSIDQVYKMDNLKSTDIREIPFRAYRPAWGAEDVDAIVRLAAEQTDQPLTDFVVQAARVAAKDTLADRRVFSSR
jgi:hypothetical protein